VQRKWIRYRSNKSKRLRSTWPCFRFPTVRTTATARACLTLPPNSLSLKNYNMERMDLHVSDKDSLYARYIYDPSNRLRFTANIGFWSTQDVANNYFRKLRDACLFPNAVNDFRAAFNRTFRGTAIGPVNALVASLITPDMSFVPGLPLGRMVNTAAANTRESQRDACRQFAECL